MRSRQIEALVEAKLPRVYYEHERAPYRQELEALDQAEIDRLWAALDDPHSAFAKFVDLDFWSKADLWSLAEAQVLSIGYDPRFFDREKFDFGDDNDRWDRLQYVTQLSARALEAGFLTERLSPLTFMNWAQSKRLILHPPLVRAMGLSSRHPDDPRSNEGVQPEQEANLSAKANAKIEELESKIVELEAELRRTSERERDLTPKERLSLYRIILGLAIEKYHYNMKAQRHGAGPKIATMLTRRGVRIDQDTVTKWLKIAAEEVGSEFEP